MPDVCLSESDVVIGFLFFNHRARPVWRRPSLGDAEAHAEEDQKRRIREMASAFRNKMDKADTITKQLLQRQSDKNFRKRALDTL